MKDTEKKVLIKDEVSKRMTEMADSIIKKLNETPVAPEKKTSSSTTEKKVETETQKKKDNEPTGETTEKKANEEILNVVSQLTKTVDALSKKIDEGIKSTKEVDAEKLSEKQDLVKSGMVDLVKSMGIDPDNVDIDFVIKEKKKSTVNADEEEGKFKKELSTDENSDDFEKQYESLSDDEKKEVSDAYFKNLLS